jgi:hypothetical protein
MRSPLLTLMLGVPFLAHADVSLAGFLPGAKKSGVENKGTWQEYTISGHLLLSSHAFYFVESPSYKYVKFYRNDTTHAKIKRVGLISLGMIKNQWYLQVLFKDPNDRDRFRANYFPKDRNSGDALFIINPQDNVVEIFKGLSAIEPMTIEMHEYLARIVHRPELVAELSAQAKAI